MSEYFRSDFRLFPIIPANLFPKILIDDCYIIVGFRSCHQVGNCPSQFKVDPIKYKCSSTFYPPPPQQHPKLFLITIALESEKKRKRIRHVFLLFHLCWL